MLFQIVDDFPEDFFGVLRDSWLAFEGILVDIGVLPLEINAEEVGNADLGGSGAEVDGLVVWACGQKEFVRLTCFHVK